MKHDRTMYKSVLRRGPDGRAGTDSNIHRTVRLYLPFALVEQGSAPTLGPLAGGRAGPGSRRSSRRSSSRPPLLSLIITRVDTHSPTPPGRTAGLLFRVLVNHRHCPAQQEAQAKPRSWKWRAGCGAGRRVGKLVSLLAGVTSRHASPRHARVSSHVTGPSGGRGRLG